MDMVAFLSGFLMGCCFMGIVAFSLGCVVGLGAGRAEAVKTLWHEMVAKHIVGPLGRDEIATLELYVGKRYVGDDDDDGGGEEPDGVSPTMNWTRSSDN